MMNFKLHGMKRSWTNERYHPSILKKGLRKTTKNVVGTGGSASSYVLGLDLSNTTAVNVHAMMSMQTHIKFVA
jgi:hypothetical protein